VAATAKAQGGTKSNKRSRRGRVSFDYALVLIVAGLVVVGLMMVYSATFDWSYQAHASSFHIASRQFLWTALGVAVMAAAASISYDQWQQWALHVMGVALVMLVLVLLIGDDRFGARRSFLNGSIQPGELAKPAMVIYVAAWLASKGDQVRDVTYGLIPFAVLIGVIAGLVVMQPDVSTAVLLVLINQLPHARQRIDDYLLTLNDPTHVSHHIQQALIALGSGGLFGAGLGQGQQKLGYLPAPHTDSIFAVLGEELGFLGCLAVIVLFVLFTYRGFKIALGAPDAFSALLACGITCWLAFQALINVAVMTGLIPFTGIALPFISSGGSAMVASLFGVGLLLSVSRGKRAGRRGKRSTRSEQARSQQKESHKRADLDRRWRNRGTRLSRSGRRTGARR
jgi:cell division protein FtsW